ncbi:MAG: hypothetical protein ACKVQV_01085, partial [Bacteroidia bacterium]
CAQYGNEIQSARKTAKQQVANEQLLFPLQWKLDSSFVDSIIFSGYKALKKKSEVTQLDVLYFDQQQPYSKKVPYYNTYKGQTYIQKPAAYIIPQAWHEVIERLRINNVKMYSFRRDTVLKVEAYTIKSYNTGKSAYEGHYLHNNVSVESDSQFIQFYSGDYLIYCNQECNRYIIETLEPQGVDAFFSWNFFDEILQQKEWFSDYLWDEVALQILKDNPKMKADFEAKKSSDATFSSNSWAMYSWIFERSNWYEPSHLRYPIYRLNQKIPQNILLEPFRKISNR